jgi:membrane-associated phospholipid phosphatase
MPARSYIFTPHALRTSARIAAAAITLTYLAACAADKSGPTDLNSRVGAERSGLPFDGGLASPRWQSFARTLVGQAVFAPTTAGRAYSFLGVAQYLAVQKAEAAIEGVGRVRTESDRGAVAGASAAVLTYLFPASAQLIEDTVTALANAGPGQPHPAFSAGEAIGRAVGAELVARATGDRFSIFSNPAPPEGPGFWTTNAVGLPVAGGNLPGVGSWFLTSPDQFRPAAPPAFGSLDFNAARDEIEHITAVGTRTDEQVATAVRWALNAGTQTASGFWLGFASDQITARGLSERDATHIFALVSSTMADATIGCWDAKLMYWLIRPWKADQLINTIALVGRPNHPSYPSGHSCVSASAGAVIGSFFPDLTNQLNGMVTEAGLSRMYAGIHYRFDIDAGQALGRNVAAFTIAADRSGNSVLTAH